MLFCSFCQRTAVLKTGLSRKALMAKKQNKLAYSLAYYKEDIHTYLDLVKEIIKCTRKHFSMLKKLLLTDSTTHSVQENMAPTMAKFFA